MRRGGAEGVVWLRRKAVRPERAGALLVARNGIRGNGATRSSSSSCSSGIFGSSSSSARSRPVGPACGTTARHLLRVTPWALLPGGRAFVVASGTVPTVAVQRRSYARPAAQSEALAKVDEQIRWAKQSIQKRTPGMRWKPLVSHLTNLGLLHRAGEILDELELQNMVNRAVYLFFLKQCTHHISNQAETIAFDIIVRMKKRGIAPDVTHYTALIAACNRVQHCYEVFDAMKSAGIEPTPVTYVAIFNALKRYASNMHAGSDMIMKYYQRFKDQFNSVPIDKDTALHVFGSVVIALAQTCEPAAEEMVRSAISDMERLGLKPNSHIAHALMLLYLNLNQPEKAYEMLDKARLDRNIAVGSIAYTSFMMYHTKRFETEQCIRLLERMRTDRIRPTHALIDAAKSLSDGLRDSRLAEKIAQLIREVGVHDPSRPDESALHPTRMG